MRIYWTILIILVFLLGGCAPTPTRAPVPTVNPSSTPVPTPTPTRAVPPTQEAGLPGGAYLGQLPPGETPQVFGPGTISVDDAVDFACTFSPDGTELYFTRRVGTGENVIYETHLANGVWSEPAPASFASGYAAFEPHVTADNQTLYFGWAAPRPPGAAGSDKYSIWAADRTPGGWSAPRYVGEGMFVSSDQSGQIYVTNLAERSVSLATLTDGRFTGLQRVTSGIHPAVAPDGSYLVYDNGDGNLRVRFRLDNGTWGTPKNLTTQGIPASASIASISPDGSYLFYVNNGDLFWVSTELIKKLASPPLTATPK